MSWFGRIGIHQMSRAVATARTRTVLAVEELWSLSPKSADVQRRRSSFGSQAARYHAVRPGYPTELVKWLVGDPPKTVVDLGAGTGVLTQQLITLGHSVVGVEPDEQMRAHAGSIGLAIREGSAEAIPVADRAADAVIVGQAWHWFDQSAALREVGRILRPGGALGLLWNLRDESEAWVAELGEIVHGEDRTSVDGAESLPGLGASAPRWSAALATPKASQPARSSNSPARGHTSRGTRIVRRFSQGSKPS